MYRYLLAGCNLTKFVSDINVLFVPIDRELGWAEEIGMNCMRVYLHHLVWETDKEGFKKRINEYLTICLLYTSYILWTCINQEGIWDMLNVETKLRKAR